MSTKEEKVIQKSTIYLKEVETLGQDILIAKQQKLELSNARNKLNEGLRALEKTDEMRAIMDVNPLCLMEFPTQVALIILKDDIKAITTDIDDLYTDIKNKVNVLRDLEHEPKIEGVSLKPLTGAEAKAIQKSFGMDV